MDGGGLAGARRIDTFPIHRRGFRFLFRVAGGQFGATESVETARLHSPIHNRTLPGESGESAGSTRQFGAGRVARRRSEDLGATLAGSTCRGSISGTQIPRVAGTGALRSEIWGASRWTAAAPMSEFGTQIFPVAPSAQHRHRSGIGDESGDDCRWRVGRGETGSVVRIVVLRSACEAASWTCRVAHRLVDGR